MSAGRFDRVAGTPTKLSTNRRDTHASFRKILQHDANVPIADLDSRHGASIRIRRVDAWPALGPTYGKPEFRLRSGAFAGGEPQREFSVANGFRRLRVCHSRAPSIEVQKANLLK
jgi:hypothetical protein